MQRLKTALGKAQQDRESAAEQVAAAEKARRAAENNADALATQSKVSHTIYLC